MNETNYELLVRGAIFANTGAGGLVKLPVQEFGGQSGERTYMYFKTIRYTNSSH